MTMVFYGRTPENDDIKWGVIGVFVVNLPPELKTKRQIIKRMAKSVGVEIGSFAMFDKDLAPRSVIDAWYGRKVPILDYKGKNNVS